MPGNAPTSKGLGLLISIQGMTNGNFYIEVIENSLLPCIDKLNLKHDE